MSKFIYKRFVIRKKSVSFYYESSIGDRSFEFRHTVKLMNFKIHDVTDKTIIRYAYFLGISLIPYYYSLQFADRIIIECGKPRERFTGFFDKYFKLGLAELMYRNNIPFKRLPKIEIESGRIIPSISSVLGGRNRKPYLVAHGGGKDSIVSGELLQKNNIDFDWFVMAYDGRRINKISENIAVHGRNKKFLVNQIPDPTEFGRVFAKKQKGYYGHKPMGAYLAFLGSFIAFVNKSRGFVVSQESSASQGNLQYDGIEINHQYTKSFNFERDIRSFFKKHLNTGVDFFSLLRPLSEIKIVEIFARHKKYFRTFLSCNKGQSVGMWCCECPKCLFVFLCIYAFTDLKSAKEIFSGKNLIADKKLCPIFLKLAGLNGHKPFECVGEIEEIQLLLYKIHQKGDKSEVIKIFRKGLLKKRNFEEIEKKYLKIGHKTFVPKSIYKKIFASV